MGIFADVIEGRLMIIRAFTAVFVIILGMTMMFYPAGAQSVRDRLAKDAVVAVVNNKKIISSELIQAFQSLPRQHQQRGLRAVYNELLERLIDDKLLTIHGRLNNLAGDPEVKTMLKAAEDQIIARIYMKRLISQSITEEALQERYVELAKNTPSQEEVLARHILVDTESAAKETIKMIKGGKSFEEVAKSHSKDPAAAQGGDLGYFRKGDMVKPFSDAAFSMQAGMMTEKPVKTEFGWHVIKVEDRRQSSAPPFERIRGKIARDLGRRIAVDVLKQARGSAKIERYALDGQALPAPKTHPLKAK